MGLLGPAIPLLALTLDVHETSLGGAFAARAGGYILGSLLLSQIPERSSISRIGTLLCLALPRSLPPFLCVCVFLFLFFVVPPSLPPLIQIFSSSHTNRHHGSSGSSGLRSERGHAFLQTLGCLPSPLFLPR